MSVFDDRLPARMVLERLASLEAKATPGPWWSEDEPNPYIFAANNASGTVMATRYFATSEDGVLIAAARNVLPTLLDVAAAAERHLRFSGCDAVELRAALSRLDEA